MEKNQKILLLIIVILVVIAAIIGFLVFNEQKGHETIEPNKFKEEYESLNGVVNDKNGFTYPTVEISNENHVTYATEDDVLEILNGGTGLIYFGFPSCPWCRNAIGPLLSAVESTNLDKLYYLNSIDMRDSLSVSDEGEIIVEKEGSKNYKKILKKLDKILEEYYVEDATGAKIDTSEKRLYVPTVVAVVKGKIVDYHVDTVESHISAGNGYAELTKEEKEELYGIYTDMIIKMNDTACSDKKGC